MHLKSPDPDGYAIVHDGRVYPVRGGVFLIPPDLRQAFPGFAVADEVPADAAQELVDLGSWEQLADGLAGPLTEPAAATPQEPVEEAQAAADEPADDEGGDAETAEVEPPAAKPSRAKKNA